MYMYVPCNSICTYMSIVHVHVHVHVGAFDHFTVWFACLVLNSHATNTVINILLFVLLLTSDPSMCFFCYECKFYSADVAFEFNVQLFYNNGTIPADKNNFFFFLLHIINVNAKCTCSSFHVNIQPPTRAPVSDV